MPLNDESFRNLQISIEDLTRAAKDWAAAIQRSGSVQGGGPGGAAGGPNVPGATSATLAGNASIVSGQPPGGAPGDPTAGSTAKVAAKLMAIGGGGNPAASILSGLATGGPFGAVTAGLGVAMQYDERRHAQQQSVARAGAEAYFGAPFGEPEDVRRRREELAKRDSNADQMAHEIVLGEEARKNPVFEHILTENERVARESRIAGQERRVVRAQAENLDASRDVAQRAEQYLDPFLRAGVKPPEALEKHFVALARRQVENRRSVHLDLYRLAAQNDPLTPNAQGMRGKQ